MKPHPPTDAGTRYGKTHSKADLQRLWWARFLDSRVEKDGQVKGFRAAWDAMTPQARHTCDRFEAWTLIKISRDHRDPNECVAASVKACRSELQLAIPSTTSRPDPAQVQRLVQTIIR